MSKFILALDSSQINTFMTCPLQWYYRYNQNLVLDTKQSPAPDKGTLVHKLLDYYYTLRSLDPNGDKLQQANAAVNEFKADKHVAELFPADDGSLEKFICDRFGLYVARWFNDDFNVKKDGVELGFSHLLYENEEVQFIIEGRIDLLNTIQGVDCFTDHKTQERTVDLYHYKPQFKTYALVTGCEYGMVNYFGMQEDKSNKLMKENKLFRRDLIHFDSWMIEEWRKKLIRTFFEIWSVLHLTNISHESIFYDRRNDSACGGPFDSWPCPFTNLCEAHPNSREAIKGFRYKVGEPWQAWK